MFIGKEKRMYYLKSTGSRLFCEAYFVLREGADTCGVAEDSLAAEAERILRERFPEKKKRLSLPTARTVALFLSGILSGTLFTAFFAAMLVFFGK